MACAWLNAHAPRSFLYRASNLGSMIGLLGYPFVVEPWLGVKAQGIAWSAGYVVFAGLAIACAAQLRRHPLVQRGDVTPNPESRTPNPACPPKPAGRPFGGGGSP